MLELNSLNSNSVGGNGNSPDQYTNHHHINNRANHLGSNLPRSTNTSKSVSKKSSNKYIIYNSRNDAHNSLKTNNINIIVNDVDDGFSKDNKDIFSKLFDDAQRRQKSIKIRNHGIIAENENGLSIRQKPHKGK